MAQDDGAAEATPMDVDDKAATGDKPDKDAVVAEPELSDEDRALKEKLEEHVKALEGDVPQQAEALAAMRESIRASTSTMTSVPKPLKFLRPHYATIKAKHGSIADARTKALASDVVSLLAMTQDDGNHDCLHFRLTGTDDSIDSWGHEYIRHLAGEIAEEYVTLTTAEPPQPTDTLMALVQQIIPYDMTHNAEAEACDLAMEVERLELLLEHVDSKAFARVCLYLLSCVPFVPEPQDSQLKQTCLDIFLKFEQFPQAMQMALKLNDVDKIRDVFLRPSDKHVRRQLAFMLARQQLVLDLDELLDGEDELEVESLTQMMCNMKLNESFLALARELDIMDPKTPEDVYKTHLENTGRSTANIDSARANLAATFVNAFVNAGFGQDKLVLNTATSASKTKWIHRNKGHGQFSAAASLGMLLMWDIDGGLQKIDTYSLSEVD